MTLMRENDPRFAHLERKVVIVRPASAAGTAACPPWVVHRLVALLRRELPFCKVEFDEINRLAHLSHEEVTAINSARRMEQADE